MTPLPPKPDPALQRFRALIEQKYVSGLNAAEIAELRQLEAGFDAQDESFYSPILARVAAGNAPPAPARSRSRRKTQ